MRVVRSFQEYCDEGIMRTITPDHHRADSLLSGSDRKVRSLHLNLEKVGVSDDNANDYVECCYDILLLLIRAKLYRQGYASAGQGAHEAEVAYLRVLAFSERDIQFIDQLRYFRNGILYYGKTVDVEYAHTVITFTKKTHSALRKKVLH